MKLRYLYQQMLASFAVVLTVLIIVSFAFIQLSKESMYQNAWKQLDGYAQSLIDDALQEDEVTGGNRGISNEKVSDSEAVLRKEGVQFWIYNQHNRLSYPHHLSDENIEKKDWKTLKKGEIIHRRFEHSKDAFGSQSSIAYVLIPIFYDNALLGVVRAESPISSLETDLNVYEENLLIAFIISCFGAGIISYLYAKYQVNRIHRLQNATHKVAEEDFDVHIETKERDEIDELANDFNQMVKSLKGSHEEIERQEERRKRFMADASHEMRTPLTTINGLLEGLAYNAIPEDQKGKSIQLMQNETNRLIRLVTENLDYEKIRTNQISMVKQNFNAASALQNVVTQLHKKAASAGNTLTLSAPKSLNVYADYDRFIQIIVNIVQNAIQFTKNGQIHLKAFRGDQRTIVEISDTGIGMSEQEVANIWERYYKADPSRKNTKYGESGLGLAIVHQLIALHEGKIEVESKEGEGTTFRLTFFDKTV